MWRYVFVSVVAILSLWLYILTLFKNNLIANTSIQLNIVGGQSAIKLKNTSDGFSDVEKKRNIRRKMRHHVPQFMLDLYERSIKDEYRGKEIYPDIVRSVVPKSSGTFAEPTFVQDFDDNHILVFDVPKANADEMFVSAELKILTIVQVDSTSLNGIERLLKISVYDDIQNKLYFLDKLQIHHTNNTWISFNVTSPVHQFLRRHENNHHLKIIISIKSFLPYLQSTSTDFKLSLMPIEENFEHDYPVLLLFYTTQGEKRTNRAYRHLKTTNAGENVHASDKMLPKLVADNYSESLRRTKRNIEEDYEEETNNIWDNKKSRDKKPKIRNTCRRKPLYIDFAEIDYDSWIVQPRGYEAYQCQGRCFYPVAEHLSPTKHAIIQALMHSVSPSRATRSCCVPTELGSISILYIDRGVLTYRYAYKDMVVKECGCR